MDDCRQDCEVPGAIRRRVASRGVTPARGGFRTATGNSEVWRASRADLARHRSSWGRRHLLHLCVHIRSMWGRGVSKGPGHPRSVFAGSSGRVGAPARGHPQSRQVGVPTGRESLRPCTRARRGCACPYAARPLRAHISAVCHNQVDVCPDPTVKIGERWSRRAFSRGPDPQPRGRCDPSPEPVSSCNAMMGERRPLPHYPLSPRLLREHPLPRCPQKELRYGGDTCGLVGAQPHQGIPCPARHHLTARGPDRPAAARTCAPSSHAWLPGGSWPRDFPTP